MKAWDQVPERNWPPPAQAPSTKPNVPPRTRKAAPRDADFRTLPQKSPPLCSSSSHYLMPSVLAVVVLLLALSPADCRRPPTATASSFTYVTARSCPPPPHISSIFSLFTFVGMPSTHQSRCTTRWRWAMASRACSPTPRIASRALASGTSVRTPLKSGVAAQHNDDNQLMWWASSPCRRLLLLGSIWSSGTPSSLGCHSQCARLALSGCVCVCVGVWWLRVRTDLWA